MNETVKGNGEFTFQLISQVCIRLKYANSFIIKRIYFAIVPKMTLILSSMNNESELISCLINF